MNGTCDKNNNSGPRILLSAFGIHTGGGLVLLKALIKELNGVLKAGAFDLRVNLDQPLLASDAKMELVPRSFVARLIALNRLVRSCAPGDTLLCFNSLPPLSRPKARVIVYVQAPHFVGAHSGIRYSYLTALRIRIERLWFKLGIQNCNEIWVQTLHMREMMRQQHPCATVKVMPLVDEALARRLAGLPLASAAKPKACDDRFSFFYPADAVGHKNHENLIRAWKILSQEGKNPSLILTLRPEEMRSVMERVPLGHHELKSIVNLGRLTRDEVFIHLKQSSALIFPSQAETFGLPLLEARALGIPIVASERDFVRDVCCPHQTFDPDSPRSIAMAVLRFMDGEQKLSTSYYSAEQFMKELLS